METAWNGSYYRDESAKAQDVRVSSDAAGVHLDGEGVAATWPFAEIVQRSGRYPGEPVRFDYGNEIVVVPDRAFLDAVQRHAPQFGQSVRDPKTARSLSILYGCFALMVFGGLAALWMARSVVENAVTAMIPARVEEAIGRAASTQISGAQVCSSAPLNQTVNAIVTRLSTATEDNPYTFRVTVTDDPVVNAFAAPGGYIVVFRGLVQRSSSPDELAGVLAHEMQHVIRRHSLKGMVRAAGIVTLVSIMTGDVSAIGAAAAQLSALSFQREDEEEADREGMRTMQRARLDPEGMVRIYQRLALESGDLPVALRYLSTHPEMKERVERLKQFAAENRYQPAAVDTTVDWAAVRTLCR